MAVAASHWANDPDPAFWQGERAQADTCEIAEAARQSASASHLIGRSMRAGMPSAEPSRLAIRSGELE
jgi:hypothetical protein